MLIEKIKADFSARVEIDVMLAALNAAWTTGTAPTEMRVGRSANRFLIAFMAFPNSWKKFLKSLDETESYLAAKYRVISLSNQNAALS